MLHDLHDVFKRLRSTLEHLSVGVEECVCAGVDLGELVLLAELRRTNHNGAGVEDEVHGRQCGREVMGSAHLVSVCGGGGEIV